MYINGYEARVDGQPAQVVRSLESMAAIAVPEGKHTVELSYPGSARLRRLFYLALWSWVAVTVFFVGRLLVGSPTAKPAATPAA